MILFVGYLIESKKKSQTIKSYISAIRALLRDDRITLNENKYLLTVLTKACKFRNDRVRTRLPIGRRLLEMILEETEIYFLGQGQVFLCRLYKALFAIGYYGLLRVGEITSGDHPVRVGDVKIADNKNKMMFILRTLKTHWKNVKPQTVKICSTKKYSYRFCPYQIIRDYMEVRKSFVSKDEPFFIFRDRSPVKPNNMRSVLK